MILIKSPNVPASSTSPTNTPSATPPKPAPAPKALTLSVPPASSLNLEILALGAISLNNSTYYKND